MSALIGCCFSASREERRTSINAIRPYDRTGSPLLLEKLNGGPKFLAALWREMDLFCHRLPRGELSIDSIGDIRLSADPWSTIGQYEVPRTDEPFVRSKKRSAYCRPTGRASRGIVARRESRLP
jgi:hypothetical protein